jgi:hypothetical protein
MTEKFEREADSEKVRLKKKSGLWLTPLKIIKQHFFPLTANLLIIHPGADVPAVKGKAEGFSER